MYKKSKLFKNINPPLFICIGVLFSYVVLILLSIFGAFLCNLTDDPVRLVGVVSFATLLLSAAISGFIISKLREDGGAILSMLSASGFIIIRIIISLFMSGTDLSDLLDCVCYLGTSVIFALFGQRKLKHRRRQ